MARRGLKVQTSTDLEEVSIRYEEAFDDAVEDLESKGIVLAVTPPDIEFTGDIPPNLPDLDSREIGELLAKTKIWSGYVSGLLAQVDGERTACNEALRAAEATARRRFADEEDMPKYEKDDLVRLDFRVVELRQRWLSAEVRYTLLSKSVYPSAQDAWEAVSREITRRGLDTNQGVRTGNVLNRRGGRRR